MRVSSGVPAGERRFGRGPAEDYVGRYLERYGEAPNVTFHTKWVPAPGPMPKEVAEATWSVAEWAVALRFDNPQATVLVLVLG